MGIKDKNKIDTVNIHRNMSFYRKRFVEQQFLVYAFPVSHRALIVKGHALSFVLRNIRKQHWKLLIEANNNITTSATGEGGISFTFFSKADNEFIHGCYENFIFKRDFIIQSFHENFIIKFYLVDFWKFFSCMKYRDMLWFWN